MWARFCLEMGAGAEWEGGDVGGGGSGSDADLILFRNLLWFQKEQVVKQ